MKTAIEAAREYVIEQAKLLVRQKATMDDVAIAVDRLELLEANPEEAEKQEEPEQLPLVPFKIAWSGTPVTKCIVKFEGGIRIGVWISFGFSTHAIEAARIEYKKLYDVDDDEIPAIIEIEKPMNHITDKSDFGKRAISIPYTANDGTPEQLNYIVDNRHDSWKYK